MIIILKGAELNATIGIAQYSFTILLVLRLELIYLFDIVSGCLIDRNFELINE